MSGHLVGLDESVEPAWRAYRGRLADRIAALGRGEELWVGEHAEPRTADGLLPCVRIRVLRGQVAAMVPGWVLQSQADELRRVQRNLLRDLGWVAPACGGVRPRWKGEWHHRTWPMRRVDEAAVAVVEVLRAVFYLPHPVLLADSLGVCPPAVEVTDADGDWTDAQLRTAYEVVDADHLGRLIDVACRPFDDTGRDDDGDLVIPRDGCLLYVRGHDTSAVRLFAYVVRDVADPDEAADVVRELNEEPWPLRFSLVGDVILVQKLVDASPFVPWHLRTDVAAFSATVGNLAVTLAERVGGRWFHLVPDDEVDEPAQPVQPIQLDQPAHLTALLVLTELEELEVSLTPEAIASVFDHDRDQLLAAIEECRGRHERALLWADDEDGGPAEVAEWHRAEAQRWRSRAQELRKGLLFLVQPEGSSQDRHWRAS